MINKEIFNFLNEKKIGIFLIHYLPLKERKEYLLEKFGELGLNKFIFWFEQEPNRYSSRIKEFLPKREKWEKGNKLMDGPKFFCLNDSDLSLIYNHLEVYKIFLKNKFKFALILEDDVILSEDFLKRLKIAILNLPKNIDVAYTDYGMGFRFQKSLKKLSFFRYQGPLTRTTASYFISRAGANKFLKNIEPIFPVDWNMRYFEIILNMNVYWLNGFLTYQGSIYGRKYKTSLQARGSPTKIQEIIFNIESKRFDNTFISNLQVFLMDYLIIIPYRKLRMYFKKP